jgi:hypothetical protein
VHSVPQIYYPAESFIFNLTENNQTNLTFSANSSVPENLTYNFYINNTLRYSIDYYSNNTNITWEFTPNYTDETHEFANLTLLVLDKTYPELNISINWSVNISHANYPVNFTGHLGDSQSTYDSYITIDLKNYFSDIDYSDAHYNQTVNFTIISNSTPSYIASSTSSLWILKLSSRIDTIELLTIEANDFNDTGGVVSNTTSNAFQVMFTTPSTTQVPQGSSSVVTQYRAMKIILPGEVVVSDRNYIEVPFSVKNTGQSKLNGINLSAMVKFNDFYTDNMNISITNTYISKLEIGESQNMSMYIYANTKNYGRYKATVYANVSSPKFNDWAEFYIDLRKTNSTDAEKALVFTEKLISENPECIELTELVKEARNYFNAGDVDKTMEKTDEAIAACKKAISSNEQIKYADYIRQNFFYFVFAIIVVLFMAVAIYVYKKQKFNKPQKDEYM